MSSKYDTVDLALRVNRIFGYNVTPAQMKQFRAMMDEIIAESDPWLPMSKAPKGATPQDPCKEVWILGINAFNQQRVIRWYIGFVCPDGCWMYAEKPTDYIDGVQEFDPVAWKPLSSPPVSKGSNVK